ncbi:MAG: hypothetical protein KAV83_08740 [Desulfobacterales bacterium]|nr:hypothetical protein [Desulfobacterales bacterium]
MDSIPCFHCGEYFAPSPRHKNQRFCKKPECQRARKAEWQRNKMDTDPVYKADQKQSHQEWLWANPNYWKDYCKRNPDKAERNRILQTIRNRRRRNSKGSDAKMDASMIAKMDASKRNDFKLVGQFWLVPVIAKMDALKVFLHVVPAGYP